MIKTEELYRSFYAKRHLHGLISNADNCLLIGDGWSYSRTNIQANFLAQREYCWQILWHFVKSD